MTLRTVSKTFSARGSGTRGSHTVSMRLPRCGFPGSSPFRPTLREPVVAEPTNMSSCRRPPLHSVVYDCGSNARPVDDGGTAMVESERYIDLPWARSSSAGPAGTSPTSVGWGLSPSRILQRCSAGRPRPSVGSNRKFRPATDCELSTMRSAGLTGQASTHGMVRSQIQTWSERSPASMNGSRNSLRDSTASFVAGRTVVSAAVTLKRRHAGSGVANLPSMSAGSATITGAQRDFGYLLKPLSARRPNRCWRTYG